jgi:hypothetical protein
MTALQAWREGAGRVNRAPWIVFGVWLATLLIALPLVMVLRGMLADDLGNSLAADTAAAGTNYDWMQEFADRASGLGKTFEPTIIGFGAVLDNASAFADNTPRPLVIAGAASIYLLLWIFLAGGIIDRLARDRPTGAHGFFAASGMFFFRFLRLAVVQWAAYGVLFGALHPLLFGRIYRQLTHDLTVERTAFMLRLALYAIFFLLVATLNVVFDYTKVRAVVEDRRSMIGAIAAGARFVVRHPAAVGVYLLNVVMVGVYLALYALVTPGAGNAGSTMWVGVAIAQLYVAARLIVKLMFWASETALFQSRLAHATYVASPQPAWPDSPAAEALTRLAR